ncbi:MAG TPA: STAS domain-containing protein [Bryobacteraceae bacterium]|nr:STAS domain-containing protein [Bryobacteraceae bacterium]
MVLRIQSARFEPDIVSVQVAGSITLGADTHLIEPFVRDLLQQGARKLILDFSGVDHMDSSGVELIYSCFVTARDSGGQLVFAAANPRVARLFSITRLDTLMAFYPTVEAACEGLSGRATAG